jgi:molybdopterin molybdotransferase
VTAPRTLLTPAEANRAILAELRPLPPERVPILEASGRVLAQVVTSPMDVPPWDNSSMDGYAVRAADLRSGTRVLKVVEEVAAGSFPTRPIGSGECTRVFTGAPVPNGADSVIRQEHTTRLDGTHVQIDDLSDADRNVRRRGEDITRGSVVLEPGAEIGPAQIGLLASLAQRDVDVHGRPRVAILSSGNEIVDLDQPDLIVSGRKIASSNSYTMIAMTLAAGAEPVSLGIAADEPGILRQRLEEAAAADLIVTSGAMSVGAHDHLRAILESGTIMRFWRLKTRPGAPVGFGIVQGTPWIGLPGNPVSTMVSFEMFVRPAIRRLMGHRKLFRRARRVRVGEPISTPPKLTHFLRVRIAEEENVLVARPTGPQGSHILTSMAEADALLIVPEHVDRLAVGDEATAILLRDSEYVEEMPY